MADINLNTPELNKYAEAVEFNAKRKNDFMFNNKGNEMALIVFRSIFRNATDSIQIVANNLNNEVTNHPEYISALDSFLSKSKTKVEILLSSHDAEADCSPIFKLLTKYSDKAFVRIIQDGRAFKDNKGRVIHFCVADKHMYRMEYDIDNRRAECNFNNIKECKMLSKLFYDVYDDSQYSKSALLKRSND